MKIGLLMLLLLLPRVALAQEPVVQWADWASYGTAVVVPAIAVVQAFRSGDQKWCRLGQFGISEVVGNGVTLTMKHFIKSPRPCLGCPPDGMPSGHTMNGVIGISAGWRTGVTFTRVLGVSTATATPLLRGDAKRHTDKQKVIGFLIGAGAEAAGQLLRCGP